MNCFLVERNLPGMTAASLDALQRVLHAASQRLTTPTAQVRHLGSVYVPRTHRCMCLFEAHSAELVRLVNDTAQAPYSTVQEVVARCYANGERRE
jgi:hypothetical protein